MNDSLRQQLLVQCMQAASLCSSRALFGSAFVNCSHKETFGKLLSRVEDKFCHEVSVCS